MLGVRFNLGMPYTVSAVRRLSVAIRDYMAVTRLYMEVRRLYVVGDCRCQLGAINESSLPPPSKNSYFPTHSQVCWSQGEKIRKKWSRSSS